jgi:hypothetical protein
MATVHATTARFASKTEIVWIPDYRHSLVEISRGCTGMSRTVGLARTEIARNH